jgi:hypothetical protein
MRRYHVVFLSDFKEQLGDVNTNFYGALRWADRRHCLVYARGADEPGGVAVL